MAVDESKTSSKPNGAEGSDGDKEEGKQDLKSIEDEFTQLKEKFFSDKIAAVKAEIEQIEIGTQSPFNLSSTSPNPFFSAQSSTKATVSPNLAVAP